MNKKCRHLNRHAQPVWGLDPSEPVALNWSCKDCGAIWLEARAVMRIPKIKSALLPPKVRAALDMLEPLGFNWDVDQHGAQVWQCDDVGSPTSGTAVYIQMKGAGVIDVVGGSEVPSFQLLPEANSLDILGRVVAALSASKGVG